MSTTAEYADDPLRGFRAAAAAAPNESTARAVNTTTLSPRFYTTDVKKMNQLSVASVQEEWDALMAEFAEDRNKGHFKKGDDWDFDPSSLPEPLKKEALDFMVSSLTSEFSGCVLYAELKKKGDNPALKELFKYMARDEARHAGFINECLKDFDLKVDMSFLVKTKEYTFFSPKFILYATYLSEKIGYARYIKIFRHLEQNPENRFHPIFQWFEEWCNDEFRHGEALALIMRANPKLLTGVNRFWVRFFQIAVFATMFVRDHSRVEFHQALGIDPEDYGMDVFRITQEISKQVFPVLVDIEHPAFLRKLRRLESLARRIEDVQKSGGWWGKAKAAPLKLRAGLTFVSLFFIPTKENPLPDDLRVAPAW